jgi:TPR repeat protein
MRILARNLTTVGLLVACFVSPAWADFQQGLTAYRAGDYAAALKEWRPLAEQGLAKAQHNLGVIFHKGGRGVPQNYLQASHWYHKAAEQGFAMSQFNLGEMYAGGLGMPKDYVKAYMWYSIANANGDTKGKVSRDVIEKQMTPAQVVEAQRLAREWKPKK